MSYLADFKSGFFFRLASPHPPVEGGRTGDWSAFDVGWRIADDAIRQWGYPTDPLSAMRALRSNWWNATSYSQE